MENVYAHPGLSPAVALLFSADTDHIRDLCLCAGILFDLWTKHGLALHCYSTLAIFLVSPFVHQYRLPLSQRLPQPMWLLLLVLCAFRVAVICTQGKRGCVVPDTSFTLSNSTCLCFLRCRFVCLAASVLDLFWWSVGCLLCEF